MTIWPLDDNLLFEYWEDARRIISEFNEYGGGPEDAEYEAYGYLDNISELIKEGNITTDAKFDFLDEAFEEYNYENSGFEDGLMDVFFEICQTKEEWEYLVKKLDEHPSGWRQKMIIHIQRKYLHDDEAYLKERMKNLQYGMDYWDLVEYYDEKGDLLSYLNSCQDTLPKKEIQPTWSGLYIKHYPSKVKKRPCWTAAGSWWLRTQTSCATR